MTLYFVRHGESTANVAGEFSNTGWKHPLTAKGVAQAHALAHDLSGLGIEQVYTSPVMRAVQTAQIVARHLDARLEIAEALREWSVGIYEGTTNPAGWALHRQVQDDWFVHDKLDSRMPGGESYVDIRARFVPFVEHVVRSAESANRSAVLVGHGGLYLAMLPAVLINVDFSFARRHGFPPGGCAVAESRADGLYCVSWCGVPLRSGDASGPTEV